MINLLSDKEIEKMSLNERKEYFLKLKEEANKLNSEKKSIGQSVIQKIAPILRSYKLEIEGEENLPVDSNAIFLVNHSNSHDAFTAFEVLSKFKRNCSIMAGSDCLNFVSNLVFYSSNFTLLDRNNKENRNDSIYRMSKYINDGFDGVIFGEGTWNLHPLLAMHNIRLGASYISAITNVPIVPTIFEYVEYNDLVKKESDLYKKCIVRFGKPYVFDFSTGLINQTNMINQEMVGMRKNIWEDNNIKRDSIEDINPELYVNHTYQKKFGALGFTFDSEKEQEYLLFLNGQPRENEYTINENGEFVPGVTKKK